MLESHLVQREAKSLTLFDAGRDTGGHWASVVGAGLYTGCWTRPSDADAHLCTGNTATCCRVYTGFVLVLAQSTLSNSKRDTNKTKKNVSMCAVKALVFTCRQACENGKKHTSVTFHVASSLQASSHIHELLIALMTLHLLQGKYLNTD